MCGVSLMVYLGLLLGSLLLLGCNLARPVVEEEVEGLGRFHFRPTRGGMEGVVIGAPHGRSDEGSDRLARMISDRTGAGLVIAYGFKAKRVSVTQPLVRSSGSFPLGRQIQRGSVFREFKRVLRATAQGELDLYIGIHRSRAREVADRIEVASSGLTFEEANILKRVYSQIRDRLLEGKDVPRLPMALEPADRISWRADGIKHHGILLIAERGLNLRVPPLPHPASAEEEYAEILYRWVDWAIKILRKNPLHLPRIQVWITDLGRIELIESRKRLPGVVIGAPHGSFDRHTAEVVRRLSLRTGFAAVIARGFTPTEAGGWRINVNRPTEKLPYSEGFELPSERAKRIYRAFRDIVFEASRGSLDLYIDIHQYSTNKSIQVATVGISPGEARIIKSLYYEIRDEALEDEAGVPAVNFIIEPLDEVEIGAWAAKAQGILRLARKSLHIEMPSHRTFATERAREAYTRILASLLREATRLLLSGELSQSQ